MKPSPTSWAQASSSITIHLETVWGQADYLLGEDIVRAASPGTRGDGVRSMANPGLYGDPDHYTKRYLGTGDYGGVHSNSGIANHAFYLAIEGGVNRTSGLAVQGVGATNREKIEQVFYRAFTTLLPRCLLYTSPSPRD